MSLELEIKVKSLGDLMRWIGAGLVAAAVVQELRKPPAERTWQGKLWDFIPYDFRPPTWDRLRKALWDPGRPTLFTETVFGVGWAVNFAALYRRSMEFLKGQPWEAARRAASPTAVRPVRPPSGGEIQEEMGE